MKYKILRFYKSNLPMKLIKENLTLEEAKEHCNSPESSSRTCVEQKNLDHTKTYGEWFDGFLGDKDL